MEVKSPSEEKRIDQLKSYLNAEGCEIGIWSNGIDRVILYRNYPNQFEDTLSEIPPTTSTKSQKHSLNLPKKKDLVFGTSKLVISAKLVLEKSGSGNPE